MLDLTTPLDEKLYEIKLIDGTILHLLRPTQAMYENTFVIDKVANSNNTAATVKALGMLFMRILNRNTEGKVFTYEQLTDTYSFEIIGLVIEDYFNFWNKERNEVDFPQSQQA